MANEGADNLAGARTGRGRKVLVACAAVAVITAGVAVIGLDGGSSRPAAESLGHVSLAASTCTGPAGTAYVADAGWDGFSAVNTANCDVLQTYNVDDLGLPGNTGDTNYSSTDESVVSVGSNLYFADAGTDTVAVIDAATLNPKNYNPPESLIKVGVFPSYLAAMPGGKQLWVLDKGPQTAAGSPAAISVIGLPADKVIATISLAAAPQEIAFSPNGAYAYVTTANSVEVIKTSNRAVQSIISGFESPEGVAASPNGKVVYVTDADSGYVYVISTATNKETARIGVGWLPWRVLFSANGSVAYVADPDSDDVSVIDTATNKVTNTIAVTGDPTSLALTPDGSELWVGENTSGNVDIVATANDTSLATVDLGLGYEPVSIVIPAVAAKPSSH